MTPPLFSSKNSVAQSKEAQQKSDIDIEAPFVLYAEPSSSSVEKLQRRIFYLSLLRALTALMLIATLWAVFTLDLCPYSSSSSQFNDSTQSNDQANMETLIDDNGRVARMLPSSMGS